MHLYPLKPATFALLFISSLAACSSVTPAGLLAASRLDPLTSDARDIAVAVGVPETVRLADGDAQFHLSFVTQRQTISETVPLRVRRSGDETQGLGNTDQTLYIASFAPEDAVTISEAQSRIRAFKAAGEDGKGRISIAVIGGCVTDARVDTLPVSTWRRTDPSDDFVRLTREQDMLASLDQEDAQALKDNLAACD